MVAGATDVFAVLEPLHEGVVGAHECPAVSIRSPAARAQPAFRHALLYEDNTVTEPRRKSTVLLVLDHAPDEVWKLVLLEFFRCVDLVVRH